MSKSLPPGGATGHAGRVARTPPRCVLPVGLAKRDKPTAKPRENDRGSRLFHNRSFQPPLRRSGASDQLLCKSLSERDAHSRVGNETPMLRSTHSHRPNRMMAALVVALLRRCGINRRSDVAWRRLFRTASMCPATILPATMSSHGSSEGTSAPAPHILEQDGL